MARMMPSSQAAKRSATKDANAKSTPVTVPTQPNTKAGVKVPAAKFGVYEKSNKPGTMKKG